VIAFDLVRTEVLDITCRITNSNAAVKTIRELLDTHETDRHQNNGYSRWIHVAKTPIKLKLRSQKYNLLVKKIKPCCCHTGIIGLRL